MVPVDTGFFSKTLDPKRLTDALNDYAQNGWELARTIHEERKSLGIFRREAHFLVLERERR